MDNARKKHSSKIGRALKCHKHGMAKDRCVFDGWRLYAGKWEKPKEVRVLNLALIFTECHQLVEYRVG